MKLVDCFQRVNDTVSLNRDIQYIVVHYAATVGSTQRHAEGVASWFSNKGAKASADYVVGDDLVICCNPSLPDRYTWHCGGSKQNTKGGALYKQCTNSNSIGIGLCSTSVTGAVEAPNSSAWSFSPQVLQNAAELIKDLMQAYGVPLERVVRHYDVTGKLCPGVVGWNADSGSEEAWLQFKQGLEEPSSSAVVQDLIQRVEEIQGKLQKLLWAMSKE